MSEVIEFLVVVPLILLCMVFAKVSGIYQSRNDDLWILNGRLMGLCAILAIIAIAVL